MYCFDCETDQDVSFSIWYQLDLCDACIEARRDDAAEIVPVYIARAEDERETMLAYDRGNYKAEYAKGGVHDRLQGADFGGAGER